MKSPIEDITEHVLQNSKHLPTNRRIELYKNLVSILPEGEVIDRITEIISRIKANDDACMKFSFYEDE